MNLVGIIIAACVVLLAIYSLCSCSRHSDE